MSDRIMPGVYFTYRDGGLVAAATTPTTEKLLIIGTALDGPANVAVPVRSLAEAEAYFGPLVYKGDFLDPANAHAADGRNAHNSLVKAMHEALIGGAGDFLLCRVGGTRAVLAAAWGVVDLIAPYGGRIYNQVTVAATSGATDTEIVVTQPASKGGPITYRFANATALSEVAAVMNNDVNNTCLRLTVDAEHLTDTAASLGDATTSRLADGTNGTDAPGEDFATTKAALYAKLTGQYGTFEALQDEVFDVCALVGIYGDDQVADDGSAATTSVVNAFADFLYNISRSTEPCHGVLGLRPLQKTDPMACVQYVTANYLSPTAAVADAAARRLAFGYFQAQGYATLDAETGATVDAGRFLSIVAGPDILLSLPELGAYVESGAAAYAGLCSAIPAKDATTLEPLGNVPSLAGAFPKALHVALSQGVGYNAAARKPGGGAYVSFRMLPGDNGPSVVNDVTCARRGSDFERLQITRIANLASRLVRLAVKPFLGRGYDLQAHVALRQQVSAALNRLYEAGAVIGPEGQGYTFGISTDPTSAKVARVVVTLTLRPSLQLHDVDVVVAMTS